MKRKLNWRPSLKDHRDFIYESKRRSTPSKIDLRYKCPPIMDQGQMGSCSGNALAGAFDFAEIALGKPYLSASRLFIYWNERAVEGDPHVDAGCTTIRDGCDSLLNKGVCSEKTWAYDKQNLLTCPQSSAYGEAYNHKITSYVSLRVDQLEESLSEGFAFVFGIPVYESFMTDEVAASGMVPMPSADESVEGGHALMCVGYDASSELYLVRNSWGTGWGDQGYCYIPYGYIDSLGDDFFSLRLTQ